MGKIVLVPGLEKRIAAAFGLQIGHAGAERVAKVAKEIAPYDPEHVSEEPHYRDNIFVVGNRVEARSSWSGFLEFGTTDTPVFATLRRAATIAGMHRGAVRNV